MQAGSLCTSTTGHVCGKCRAKKFTAGLSVAHPSAGALSINAESTGLPERGQPLTETQWWGSLLDGLLRRLKGVKGMQSTRE